MRVLLDECLPRRLKRLLADHEVVTVPEVGWAGKSNGDLLRLASERFDVFGTVDRNLAAQQSGHDGVAVVILATRSNRLQDIELTAVSDPMRSSGCLGKGDHRREEESHELRSARKVFLSR